MNIQFMRSFAAFISVSAIVGSTVIMPVNVLADAEPSAENIITQSTEPTPGTAEEITTSPLTVSTTEGTDSITTTEQAMQEPIQQAQVEVTLVNNTILATAAEQETTSGDITATDNEDIGNTTTGQAESSVFIANDATNITSLEGGTVSILTNPTDFTEDILISPQAVSNTLSSTPILLDGSVIIDNTVNIANIVVVDSSSGSATIVNNDNVGNATTGDAVSDVSILNMANNIVATGDVFVGVITVNGDYADDIVLSQALIDYLINGTMSDANMFTSDVDISSLQVVTNSIDAMATSGNINIERNDNVGSSSTGDAQTFVLIKNFNGSFVLYGNSLLFIVNVMGDWTGGILGEQNNNVALLSADGSGLSVSTPTNDTLAAYTSLKITNTISVDNTVSATAKSGSITITDNDDIGNAATGDATVRVKILNVLNTIVSFGNWLGVIFINIFGDWDGGVVMQQSAQTEATVVVTEESYTYPTVLAAATTTPYNNVQKYFRSLGGSASASTIEPTLDNPAVLAAVSNDSTPAIIILSAEESASYLWIALVALLSGGMLAGNRVFALRQ